MKYHLKDHPYLFLTLVVLALLIGSIVLGFAYNWSVYSICAVVLSGIGFLILLGMAIGDYHSFKKKYKRGK